MITKRNILSILCVLFISAIAQPSIAKEAKQNNNEKIEKYIHLYDVKHSKNTIFPKAELKDNLASFASHLVKEKNKCSFIFGLTFYKEAPFGFLKKNNTYNLDFNSLKYNKIFRYRAFVKSMKSWKTMGFLIHFNIALPAEDKTVGSTMTLESSNCETLAYILANHPHDPMVLWIGKNTKLDYSSHSLAQNIPENFHIIRVPEEFVAKFRKPLMDEFGLSEDKTPYIFEGFPYGKHR